MATDLLNYFAVSADMVTDPKISSSSVVNFFDVLQRKTGEARLQLPNFAPPTSLLSNCNSANSFYAWARKSSV